ncbi:MlaD family protein [Paraconexibacter sp.]|uniref:MlaD family protein n=1 Tax=Paraconexibacter sp. TaxID=2949640 RepID=UPI0035696F2A
MVKQAPTLGRLLTMVGFALSCFALLLFLWVSFGGPTPLKPNGYRFEVAFPEATQLAVEADVRVAGVAVGKVREKRRSDDGNSTVATIEIEPKYAPIASDARATLRQKTLLGETYVEMTTGSASATPVPEGGRLPSKNVKSTVELDEILDALDPFTRSAFRTWQQSLAVAVDGRGRDLNDSFGNLPGFIESGGELLDVLNEQRASLRGLVKNTGVVFGALTRREDQLRRLVENGDTVFTAIQREREAFAATWRIFPTFLDESKATFTRLDSFSRKAQPVVADLKVAMDDLAPTLDALGDFGPELRRLFVNLDPLIKISRRSLPATTEIVDGLGPLLNELGPWLGEINPILGWISEHQHTLSDMFANLGVATAARTKSQVPGAPGHYLRQFGPTGTETIAVYRDRVGSNRGNAYLNPLGVVGPAIAANAILPSFDCKNAGGERPAGGTPSAPACHVQKPYAYGGATTAFPQIAREDYSKK